MEYTQKMDNSFLKREDNYSLTEDVGKHVLLGNEETSNEGEGNINRKILNEQFHNIWRNEELQHTVNSEEIYNSENVTDYILEKMINSEDVEIPYDFNPAELWKKIENGQFDGNNATSLDRIDHKIACIIYRHFYAFQKESYCKMKDDLWKLCGQIEEAFNIPSSIKMTVWETLSSRILLDVMIRNRNDYDEFYNLVKKGSCNRLDFVHFIKNKRRSWKDAIDELYNKWVNGLALKLINYIK
ncbi:Phist protein (Pf-fam-b), unknown function [Plasmodium ovale wallikeri]|uniref:Plasmodium RESA N-terminal domain-containing protein n=2 Tax=Plasmodium ovale TaxID=36330 RepID=A0A1A9ALW0_PLAOA|nr:Phist protein (Pf-fam-b), unknown function [Plasmodium ovale wallikeri]SBT57633.1 Phist protein (Pf-fam-b), unknown function [Plasmodium ovale wallikeri]SBT72977.1 Plasmodium exported protein (PHIST), unknown function [Plasmodium ovale]